MECKLIFTLCLISLMLSANSEDVLTDAPPSSDGSPETLSIDTVSETTAPTDVTKSHGSNDILLPSVSTNDNSPMDTSDSPNDSLHSGTFSTESPAAAETSQVLKVDVMKDDGGNTTLLSSIATIDNSLKDKSDSPNDSLYIGTSSTEVPDADKISQQVLELNVTKADGDNDILVPSVATNGNSTMDEYDSPNEPLHSGISSTEGSLQLALLTNFFLAVKTIV